MSEQLGKTVSESGDPNTVDGDCQPNCDRRPGRSKRLNCPRNHDRSLSFSIAADPACDDVCGSATGKHISTVGARRLVY
jgi:hypothetical protein